MVNILFGRVVNSVDLRPANLWFLACGRIFQTFPAASTPGELLRLKSFIADVTAPARHLPKRFL
jgi:hypothetical protein